MKRIWLVALVTVMACGNLDGLEGTLTVAGPFDEAAIDGAELTEAGPPEVPVSEQEGEPADDVPVGEPIATEDPGPVADECLECTLGEPPLPVETEEAAVSAPEPEPQGLVAGTKLITLRYTAMRVQPNKDASTAAVHTGSGPHGGHPKGVIPPGQAVRLVESAPTSGYYKVRYKEVTGWVSRSRVAEWDEAAHPIEFAQRTEIRNAFFMHQIKRSAWNKDGPSSSGNCAPTSLTMAAKIFGKGPKGVTVERNIHEVRDLYGASANENDGTSRSEIVRAARKLGFDVQELGTNLSIAGEMDRLDKQLGWKRAVVLEGRPGKAYRDRMTRAFRNGGSSRSYTFAGNHSILVVARLASGKYLVADPISEVGMVTMERSEMKSFIAAWGGTGTAVYDKDI